ASFAQPAVYVAQASAYQGIAAGTAALEAEPDFDTFLAQETVDLPEPAFVDEPMVLVASLDLPIAEPTVAKATAPRHAQASSRVRHAQASSRVRHAQASSRVRHAQASSRVRHAQASSRRAPPALASL